MKILQIVPSVSLVYGGPSQMVLGLSQALAKAGVEITLLTTDSNGDFGQPPLAVPLQTPIEQNGYEIIYFPCSPFRRYKFSLPLLQWLYQQADQYDLAHIHALFSPVSTAAATICRMRKLPYIMRPLGTLDPADLQKKSLLKNIYGHLLEKPNLAAAAAVHFTTAEEARISARFGAKTKDIIVPLGVELSPQLPIKGKTREQFGISAAIPLILFMSRIDPKKGLDILIPALERLQEQNYQFHFVLAGANPQDPNYENNIKQQIQSSSIAPQTSMTGFVQGEKKLELLQDADLFVLPSYYENFGIAVAEAMFFGKPVLISDRVYIYDDIQSADAGWVSSCDVTELSKFLQIALEHTEIRQQKGLNAQNYAKTHYSWSAIAQQICQTYQQLLNP